MSNKIPLPHPDDVYEKYKDYVYTRYANDSDARIFKAAYQLGFANGYIASQQGKDKDDER